MFTALDELMSRGGKVVFATGKARGLWVASVRDLLGLTGEGWTLNGPAAFLQGLLVCAPDGSILRQHTLDHATVSKCLSFAHDHKATAVLYLTDDRSVTEETNSFTDLMLPYGEPAPEGIGSQALAAFGEESSSVEVYKIVSNDIVIFSEELVATLREALAETLGKTADLTQVSTNHSLI